MEGSGQTASKLALISLAISLLWYVGVVIAVAKFYSEPQPTPQRWDALLCAAILFWEWIITAPLSIGIGVVSLYQIRRSQRRKVGRLMAIAGIALAALPGGLLWRFLY